MPTTWCRGTGFIPLCLTDVDAPDSLSNKGILGEVSANAFMSQRGGDVAGLNTAAVDVPLL